MVRRLLSIAVLATLAVALPAAAQDETASASDPGAVNGACSPSALYCSLPENGFVDCDPLLTTCSVDLGAVPVVGGSLGDSGEACPPWKLDPESENVFNVFVIDPTGCVRAKVREVLNWPPMELSFVLI